MTRTHEIRPDLDEGIDRKVLSQLRARFLKLNEGRMARAMEGLSTRQQAVLTLLPLFFHVNHPCLLYTSPSPRDRQKSRMPSSA